MLSLRVWKAGIRDADEDGIQNKQNAVKNAETSLLIYADLPEQPPLLSVAWDATISAARCEQPGNRERARHNPVRARKRDSRLAIAG
jgi:hypothetical protein